jgi:hypothetical protein
MGINQIMPQQTGNYGSSSHGISNAPQYNGDQLKPLRNEVRGIQSPRSNFSYCSSRSPSNASGRSRVSNRSALGPENTHQLRRPVPPVEMQKPKMPKGFERGLTTFAIGFGNRSSMEGKRSETGCLAPPNGRVRGTNGVRGQNLYMLEKRDGFLAAAHAQELSSRKGNRSGGNTNS